MSLNIWPALADSPGWWDCEVDYERAAYGKAHLQPTDYRWLAQSPGFLAETLAAAGAMNWGPQDKPARLSAWVSSSGGCYAVRGYASKARDSAGRSGGLEKQFLALGSPGEVPVPLLALRALECVESWDESVWWDRWKDPQWADRDYVLALAPSTPLPVRTPGLVFDLGQAVRRLLDLVTKPALERFYAELYSGLRPAVLETGGESLPGVALAALLLPLPAARAAHCALTAGIPSSSITLDRFTEWDGIALPFASGESVSEESNRRAQIAVASFDLGLDALARLEAPLRHPGEAPADLPVWVAPATRFFLYDDRNFRPEEQVRSVRVLPEAARRYVQACADLHFAAQACEDRYAAETPNRRWKERQRHRTVLTEVVRAWLLAVCPDRDTWVKYGASSHFETVPPLLFVAHLPPADWPALAVYPEGALARLLRLNPCCSHPALPPGKLRSWLESMARDCPAMQKAAAQALEVAA